VDGVLKLKFCSEEQKPCGEIGGKFKSGSGYRCLFQRHLVSFAVVAQEVHKQA
jgi:hypothetical protein